MATWEEMFNTPLSPTEEAAFQSWVASVGRQGDVEDYDLRGAWKAGAGKKGGHLPDAYKKPNHPTFSDESIYNGGEFRGGHWEKDGSFTPGPTNLKLRSEADLLDYFRSVEPESRVNLPAKPAVQPPPIEPSLAGVVPARRM